MPVFKFKRFCKIAINHQYELKANYNLKIYQIGKSMFDSHLPKFKHGLVVLVNQRLLVQYYKFYRHGQ